MKLLIDVNLSPAWTDVLMEEDVESVHWSEVGKLNATDLEIINYAKENGMIIFTHDLDFGNILAATGGDSPSIIQIRTHDIAPESLKDLLLKAITQFKTQLQDGALITIHPGKSRARILPIR